MGKIMVVCFCLQILTLGTNDAKPLCLEPCNAGSFMNYSTTLCQHCPPGTYNALPGCPSRCTRCRQYCHDPTRSNAVKYCSPENDLECRCDDGFYATSQDSVCYPQPKCGIGYGVKRIGTPTEPTLCKKCLPGTESNSDSSWEPCRPVRKIYATSERKSAITAMVTSVPRSSTRQTTELPIETRQSESGNFMLITVLSVIGSTILVVALVISISLRCRRLKLKHLKSVLRNEINFVVQNLSPDLWKRFIRCLPGAPDDHKIDEVVHDHRQVRDQMYQALKIWTEENTKATRGDLVYALKQIGQNRLAEQLGTLDCGDSCLGVRGSDKSDDNVDNGENHTDEGEDENEDMHEEQTFLKKPTAQCQQV